MLQEKNLYAIFKYILKSKIDAVGLSFVQNKKIIQKIKKKTSITYSCI